LELGVIFVRDDRPLDRLILLRNLLLYESHVSKDLTENHVGGTSTLELNHEKLLAVVALGKDVDLAGICCVLLTDLFTILFVDAPLVCEGRL
jgi:hypothetical protein